MGYIVSAYGVISNFCISVGKFETMIGPTKKNPLTTIVFKSLKSVVLNSLQVIYIAL